ncbi:MAG TPA: glycoside hydrolase family 3 N-terminal domain-containing protein [Ktedonobacterales bacterium]|nr:glycoside hydrolase family 3 N-terminal domain-containing protein [Ktedonobacterales bacterium]
MPPTEHHPPESRRQAETSARAGRNGLADRQKKRLLSVALVVIVLVSLPLGARVALHFLQGQPSSTAAPRLPGPTYLGPKNHDPERAIARQVDHLLAQMTLQQELGQLIVVAFNGTTLTPDLQNMIAHQYAGGVMLYAYNITGYAQIKALDAAAQAQAKVPLFIATDQEGGLVNRLESIIGPEPSALDIGNTNNPENALKSGIKDGQMLKRIGINVDLAPVVDVHSAPQTVIITRMFGTTPEKVTTFAGAYLNGLQSQGVIGCLKHWPGLGASPVDPHDALPVITRSQQELNEIDFAPYRALIRQGDVNMIMSTHELLTAYDKTMPSSLSPILIDQVLRNDLGYQGVVITDGLYMGALGHWTIAQAAVLALIAGNDLLLGPWDSYQTQLVLDALQAAVASGQISKARVDLSVARILTLKIEEGLIPVSPNW